MKITNIIEKQTKAVMEAINNLKTENLIKPQEEVRSVSKTYSRVVEGAVVLVKPTKESENQETRKILKEKISPMELGIGIKGMKDAQKGGVLVQCRDNIEANKLKAHLEPKIGINFVAVVPTKKKPRIKIVGMDKQYDEPMIIQSLTQQNPGIITSESIIKLIVSKKMVKTYFAIIDDSATFH